MPSPLPWSVLPTLIAFGCSDPNPEKHNRDSGSQQWSDLEAIDLDSFRLLRTTRFGSADRIERLVADSIHGPVIAIDANRVFATDHLFRHDPAPACINAETPSQSSNPAPGEPCPDGSVRVSRGTPSLPSKPTAIAKDETQPRIAILTEDGSLHWIITDPTDGDAIDFMKPRSSESISEPLTGASTLAVSEHGIAMSDGNRVSIHRELDGVTSSFETESVVLDAMWIGTDAWVLTEDAAWKNGTRTHGGGHHLVSWDNQAWIIRNGELTNGTTTWTHPGLIGPATQMGSDLVAITSSGLARIAPNGTAKGIWEGSALDIDSNDANEVVVLHNGNEFSAFTDETATANGEPLQTWISTFMERPRNANDSVTCNELERMLDRAQGNVEWLNTLPAAVALGVTPSHMARAMECNLERHHDEWFENMDVGALFHHLPDECAGDMECHTQWLMDSLESFERPVSWASGLGTHTELGIDWVQSLIQTQAVDRYAFLGLGSRPDIPHNSDLRGKDAWSEPLGEQSRVWYADTLESLTHPSTEIGLAILPGDTIPAFNAGRCENLWLYECHPLGRGAGNEISDTDIESLNILFHRAMAGTNQPGTHTWNFHLPDIGVYTYTDGCEPEHPDGSTMSCEASRVEAWILDLHQRFALNDRLIWVGPGGVRL